MGILCPVPQFLTVEELAPVVRLSVGTIKNLLTTNPNLLPPRRVVAGTGKVLFFSEDVYQWMRTLPTNERASKRKNVAASEGGRNNGS